MNVGQSATQMFSHAKTSVQQPKAKFKLEEYSIKKKPRNNFSLARVEIEGKLEQPDHFDLKLLSFFKVSIGGIGGYTLSIPASEFKQKKSKKQTEYTYKNRLIAIKISSRGKINIEIEKADLSSLDQSQFKYIGISIDNIFADQSIDQQCRKNACKLPKQGYCHFDREDEE